MDTFFEKGLAHWSLDLLKVCNRELQIDFASILGVIVVFSCSEKEFNVRQLTRIYQLSAVDKLISVDFLS